MPKYPELTKALEDLTKQELEDLKLKTEIVKIRFEIEEKNKPWVLRNLAILIPSFIGLGTLLTGYFTGYFSVESKRLENQRHDLVQDINAFTERKDSLNQKNLALLKAQEHLEKEANKLKEDNAQVRKDLAGLAKQTDTLNTKTKLLSSEKEKLNTQVQSIKNEKADLLVEQAKLKNDVRQGSFKEYISSILKEPVISTGVYTNLLNVVKSDVEFQQSYISSLKKIADTSQNMIARAVIYRLLYDATENIMWRDKLFDLATKYSNNPTNINTFYSNYRFWEPFYWNFGKSVEEKIEIAKFLAHLVNKLKQNPEDVKNILSAIGFLESYSNYMLKLYETAPNEFCVLFEQSKEFCLKGNTTFLDNGSYYFLETNAPIAFVCIISELLKSPGNLESYSKNQLLASCLQIIEKNQNILKKPTNPDSSKSWEDWQNDNAILMNISFTITKYCGNSTQLSKVIGKRF